MVNLRLNNGVALDLSKYFFYFLALALFLSTPASAEVLLFSKHQWGDANLRIEQSTGRSIESVLAENPNFEPLVSYPKSSGLRRLSLPVGRLDIRFPSGKFQTCTASVISSDLILTNYHCVPGTGQYGPVTEASLLMGYYSVQDEASTERFRVHVKPVDSDLNLDFSVLRVEGNPSKKWGTVTLSDKPLQAGEPLLLIHHPSGQPKHVTRGSCRAGTPSPISKDELFHKCDTLPGSSGAPIISSDHNGVVAIHYAGAVDLGPEKYNYGKLIQWIKGRSSKVHDILLTLEIEKYKVVDPTTGKSTFAGFELTPENNQSEAGDTNVKSLSGGFKLAPGKNQTGADDTNVKPLSGGFKLAPGKNQTEAEKTKVDSKPIDQVATLNEPRKLNKPKLPATPGGTNFEEDFENPRHVPHRPFCRNRFEQGEFVLSGISNSEVCAISFPWLGTLAANTRIETLVRQRTGATFSAYGLMFGDKDGNFDRYYNFVLTDEFKFGIGLRQGGNWNKGDWKNIVPWQTSPAVNTGNNASNTLALEIRGREVSYFINGVKLGEFSATDEVEGSIGFYVYRDPEVSFDYLRATSLTSAIPSAPKIVN